MIQDYQNCCRLCLSTEPSPMLPSIFNPDGAEKMIAPKILYCYSLFIFPQDPFSKRLCMRCLFHLEQYWTFKQKYVINNNKLFKALSTDPTIKCSEEYLKSLERASKNTTAHTLLSCKTPEEVAQVYHKTESLINFSWRVENVEIIDICSDEEDNKELVKSQIQRNLMPPLNSNFLQLRSEFNHDGPSNSSSSRISASSDFSDDALSTYSDKTVSSRNTVERNTFYGNDSDQNSQTRLSRRKKSLGIDQNSNVENLSKTRKKQQNIAEEVLSKNRSELRNLRPLLKKNKNAELSLEWRSRSRSHDSDADSFGSMESLNTIDSNVSTSSKKRNSSNSSTPKDAPEKTSESSKKQKLNGPLSNNLRSLEKKKRGRDLENAEKDAAPASKKRKISGSQSSSTSSTAVASPVVQPNPIKRYSCKYCMKTFKLKIDRKQHFKTCPDKKIINCNYCLKRMYREEDLYKHNLCHLKIDVTRLPQNRHRCNDCNRYFYPKPALKKHKKLHHSSVVPEVARKNSSRVRNEESRSKAPSSLADVSDDEIDFNDEENLPGCSSELITNRNDPNSRDFRSKRMRNKVDLPLGNIDFAVKQPKSQGLNMETSAEYVNNFCKYCHDVFKDDKELWKHMLISHKWVDENSLMKSCDSSETHPNYKCSFENCKKKFVAFKDLVLHSQVHIPLKCSHCEFLTYKFSLFLRHPSECRNQKNQQKLNHVSCCNKKFPKAFNFYLHKMYECAVNKMASNPLALSEVKDVGNCGICSKNVGPSSEELLVHLIHHACSNFGADLSLPKVNKMDSDQAVFLKTFELCPKEWSKENRLDSYECAECKDSFLSLQTFQEHMRKCFSLSCSKCKLSFSNNSDYIVHNCVPRCKLCLTKQDNGHHVCLVRKVFVTGPNKKYKCSLCNAAFPNLLVCHKHILRHFPSNGTVWQENVECQLCNEKLSNQLTLDVHYHLKHPPSGNPAQKASSKKEEEKLFINTGSGIADNLNKSAENKISEEDLNKRLSIINCVRSGNNQSFCENGRKKSETNQETTKNSSAEVGCQTPLLSMPLDPLPNSDKELKINIVTPVKRNSAVDNYVTPTKSIGSPLSSPNYKVGDKDWSWNIVSSSIVPVSNNSHLEPNPASS